MKTSKEHILMQNGTLSFRWIDIDFRTYQDVSLPMSKFTRILNNLELDSWRVFELGEEFLLVRVDKDKSEEYKNSSDRMFSDTIKTSPRLKPQLIQGVYQVWEIVWGFDYWDSEYFVISLPYPMNDETHVGEGVYRWVITDPKVDLVEDVKSQVSQWSLATDTILGQNPNKD